MGVSLLHLRDMVAHGMTDKTFGPLRNFRKDVSLWTEIRDLWTKRTYQKNARDENIP